jgi:MtrB/PioB family decaheme-associated outer membrane protein
VRRHRLIITAACLLIAAAAVAQETPKGDAVQPDAPKAAAAPTPDAPLDNQADFGIRGTMFGDGSDQARFERYRDLRNGPFLDRLRINKETDTFRYSVQADNVGYRDQRFSAAYENFGTLKINAEWNQIPLFYSQTTSTLYNQSVPGQLTLADSIQSGIQNGTLTLNGALLGAAPFDLRTQRNIGSFSLTYNATPNVDLGITFKNTQKTGAQPWGGSFGISGGVATELPVPIDTRTTELGTSLEHATDGGYARLGYDGSFFHNSIPTLTWDNPSRITDSATLGPAEGRMALWPNTDMNTVSAAGGLNLPGRSHATAFLSVANMTNNNPLLPFTVNTALVSPTLDRTMSDIKAVVTSMNYAFTSRPTSTLWFSARYRQYDFDNKTVPFNVANGVNYDTAIVALNISSEPYSTIRHTFDADATYSPFMFLGFRAGYTREQISRTYRVIADTTEDTGRASVDLTGISWLSVRGVYEHAVRIGSPEDTLALLYLGEQPGLSQYDIANRNQDRVNAIVQVTPAAPFSVNGSAGLLRQDYPGTDLGLRNNDSHVYTIGVDYVPSAKVSFGAQYGYDKNDALEASRSANPLPANTLAYLNDPTQQFNDPTRDWTDSNADRTHTASASLDLLKIAPKTDIRIAYNYSHAVSTYTYALAPNSPLPPVVPLTPVLNELQRGTVDARYAVTRHLAVGLAYWFDKYRVDDFALGPVSSLAQPATGTPTLMLLGYFYAPYTANTVMARVTYLW